MLGAFGAAIALPFAVQGEATAVAASVEGIKTVDLNAALRGYVAYARYAPAIGSAGKQKCRVNG